MNDPEKRICRYCAEAIEAKAKLCPHCHQWLTLMSFRHPLVMLLVHLVPLSVFYVALLAAVFSHLDRLQNPKPYYSEYPGSLRIIESRMNWTQTDDGLRIYVTGVLTNTSPVTWMAAEFDCRFFDAKGVMVDASTGYCHLYVCPHDESAFRVAIIPIARTNDYVSFKISVSNARNTKGLY
jgi:hypothetical protein